MDGCMAANNPTMCAVTVAKKILGNSDRKIIVISVGAGSFKRDIDGEKASSYGGIQWLFHDIFDILLDESLVEIQTKLIINQCNYIRINGDLGDIKSDLDNTETDNMQKLCELGTSWWDQFADQLMPMLEEHPFFKPKAIPKRHIRKASVFTFDR
jgi:hypothetical protein